MKKNTVIILIIVVAFCALLGGGVIAYNLLAPRVSQPESPSFVQDETNPQNDASVNMPAPDFTVYDDNGDQVNLSDKYGKPIVVNFWATWCPPCQNELPHFNALSEEMGAKVEFMMVDLTDGNGETADSTRAFLAENGYTFPIYYDDDQSAASTYAINSIPLTVFIDADGNIIDQHLGAMDEETLRMYVEELIR